LAASAVPVAIARADLGLSLRQELSLTAEEFDTAIGSSPPLDTSLTHPFPERPLMAMLSRYVIAIVLLIWVPAPIVDPRRKDLGSLDVPDGMLVVLRLRPCEHRVRHTATKKARREWLGIRQALGRRKKYISSRSSP
jgi:hypothetical protein